MNFVVPYNAVAQSPGSENVTFPMASQRIPTTPQHSGNNDEFLTQNASDIDPGNVTFPMASQRIPTTPQHSENTN
jgi:hypothetical protein